MSNSTVKTTDAAALAARVAELEAQLAKANQPRELSFKVSEKGAVSVYGMGRFPVTLYSQQWDRLLNASADLRAFIKANESKLAVKGSAVKAA